MKHRLPVKALFVLLATALYYTPLFAKKTHMPQSDTTNTLTNAEKKAGWQLLFNGSNLKGWRTYQHKTGSWSVSDGAILCQERSDKQYADLITEGMYGDFELAVDWKIDPGANSGILYRVTEQYPQTYLSGPEYQLLDDKGYAGKVEEDQHTGSNYAMQAPSADATRPVGEWNHTVIIVHKGHVEHWLNNQKIVSYELGSPTWKQQKEKGKWKDAAGYGMAEKGHIALQDYHGKGKVWFRNIKIRPL
jgi:hypothetical protein